MPRCVFWGLPAPCRGTRRGRGAVFVSCLASRCRRARLPRSHWMLKLEQRPAVPPKRRCHWPMPSPHFRPHWNVSGNVWAQLFLGVRALVLAPLLAQEREGTAPARHSAPAVRREWQLIGEDAAFAAQQRMARVAPTGSLWVVVVWPEQGPAGPRGLDGHTCGRYQVQFPPGRNLPSLSFFLCRARAQHTLFRERLTPQAVCCCRPSLQQARYVPASPAWTCLARGMPRGLP